MMYRFPLVFICCLLWIQSATSQISTRTASPTGTLTATLVDASENGEGIAGAVVELAPVKDTTKKKYNTSGYQGRISIAGLAYGTYRMKISFLGYKNIERQVTIGAARVNLGRLQMKQSSQKIDAVVLEVQALRTSQKGDTVSYNANAFKVTKDADAEGLLAKMPGVTIVDGEVEAQGETVQKIFVDGKEFFGNDVSSALKNLPAEIVSKVEVFNKLSDQAQFTGIDDGEGYKAINIVTDPKKRNGVFGKLYAGYGFDDKYIAGGNVNMFRGDHRLSLIGLFNNVNQQNFSTEDILGVTGGSSGRGGMQSRGGGRMRRGGSARNFMVRPQSGISTVASVGLNYSGTWWKKVDVQGSYFFNTTKNENEKTTQRQYYSQTDTVRWYNGSESSSSRNFNHRFNAKIEYKINENQELMIRPSLSFQSYSTNSSSDSRMDNYVGTESALLNLLKELKDSKSSGYNISNTLLYRTKLGKPGRTLTLDFSFRLNRNQRDNNSDSELDTLVYAPNSLLPIDTVTSPTRLYTDYLSSGYRLNGSVIYTEPLTEKSQLSFQYRISYNYSDADKRVYPYDFQTEMFKPVIDPVLSNVYNSGYLTHRVGPGYRLGDKKNMLAVNVYYQRATLTGDQEYPFVSKLSAGFDNAVYFAMWNHTFNPTNTLRVFLRSYTDNPSVTNLQNVVDNTNPQFVTGGNPNLKPTYTHNLFMNYNKSSVTKGRTFMLMLGASLENNFIGDSTAFYGREGGVVNGVKIDPYGQFTKPVNLDGSWNVRGAVSYGFPVKWIKSNLNLNASMTYNESPSIMDGVKNISSGYYYNYGAVLGSNISEKIDFTFGYNGGYNIARNSIQRQGNKDNRYLTHSARGRIKWVAWLGFTLSGDANYMRYKGITDQFNEEYLICNVYLGKKLFRNQRGEINVGVNDLLNQNKSFARNIQETYIENVTNKVLGRYWGFQFTYNLRNFGSKSKGGAPDALPSESGPGGHRGFGPGPGGPPPGGFGRRPF